MPVPVPASDGMHGMQGGYGGGGGEGGGEGRGEVFFKLGTA